MRTIITIVAIFSLFTTTGQELFKLNGEVRNNDGSSYFGATVEVFLKDSLLKKTTLDRKGQFIIDSLPKSEMLRIETRGHGVWTSSHFFLRKFNSQEKVFNLDADSISITLRIDTLDTDVLNSIEYLNMRGTFYCLGDNCLDSNGRESGIITIYVSGIGISYSGWQIKVKDKIVCSIYDKDEGFILHIKQTDQNYLFEEQLTYEQMKEFLKENFKNGELKSTTEFRHKDKKLNNAP